MFLGLKVWKVEEVCCSYFLHVSGQDEIEVKNIHIGYASEDYSGEKRFDSDLTMSVTKWKDSNKFSFC